MKLSVSIPDEMWHLYADSLDGIDSPSLLVQYAVAEKLWAGFQPGDSGQFPFAYSQARTVRENVRAIGKWNSSRQERRTHEENRGDTSLRMSRRSD